MKYKDWDAETAWAIVDWFEQIALAGDAAARTHAHLLAQKLRSYDILKPVGSTPGQIGNMKDTKGE